MSKSVKATPMHARALRQKTPAPAPKPKPTGDRLVKVLAENGEK